MRGLIRLLGRYVLEPIRDFFSDLYRAVVALYESNPLGAIVVVAAAVALATTPLAFAILGRTKWFQARRGRTMQRPSFLAVVVGMLLVMGIPAIFLVLAVKSQYFDRDRYEFDPNRTLSVLDQGRQFESSSLRQSLEKADEAVRAEMARLAEQRKNLLESAKKLDEALVTLGEAALRSPGTFQAMPRVVEAMGGVRQAAGFDASPRWDALVERLEGPPPTAMVAAAPVAASPEAPAAAAPIRGLAKPEFEAEVASVPGPQRPLAALLPLDDVPDGWEVGDLGGKHLETFDAGNLYEKINGRAESFVQYDVQGMSYANFHPKGDESGEVQLYVFEFAGPLKAFGKYGSEKPQEAEAVAIGAEGYAAAGSVSFYQDRYFIQVVSTSDDPKYARFSESIARRVSGRIGGPEATPDAEVAEEAPTTPEPAPAARPAAARPAGASPTELFKLLPAEPKPGRPQYVAQDAFGYSFLSNVFLADYQEGGVTWQGFLRPFADPETAREAYEKYLETAKADGAELREVEAEGADRMVIASNIGLVDVVFLKGNALAGANGATEGDPAERFARAFARSLPVDVPTIPEDSPGAAGEPAGPQ